MTPIAPPRLHQHHPHLLAIASPLRRRWPSRRSARAAPANGPQQVRQSESATGESGKRSAAAAAGFRHPALVDTPSGKIDYTATAGTLTLYNQSGERSAAIFYTAYVSKGADAGKRPLTFAFNGGPGAASAYLNMGLVGPRIAQFGLNGRDAAAAKIVDNPDTWLAFTDLVLIDPVGTGWSRPAKPDGGKAFWGVGATPN